MKYPHISLVNYYDELSSIAPTPGGGHYAATIAAGAVALLNKSINITNKKEVIAELEILQKQISNKDRFLQIAEEDAAAFALYMQALKSNDNVLLKEAGDKLNNSLQEIYNNCITIVETAIHCRQLIKKNIASDFLAALEALLAAAKMTVIIEKHNSGEPKKNITIVKIIKKRSHKMRPIKDILRQLNAEKDAILLGEYIAKLPLSYLDRPQKGRLILVSAISPTPKGEGKTTTAIALAQGLSKTGVNVIAALREPSLGPVFGVKGGATGGGKTCIEPQLDINLHFSGDIHALTTINNLIAATIDNHIFHGNSLKLDINNIYWRRAVDLNDRALRKVTIDAGKYSREESFIITVATEVMAIFALAENVDDFHKRIARAIIGKDLSGKFVFVEDLKITQALVALCLHALKPNLVQTTEGVPAIVHGGPFANIAHGCNSVIATRMALGFADYVVTEAGFGFDLGGEKFFDIKCRKAKLQPQLVVLVVTVKGLIYHGIGESDEQKLLSGLNTNLAQHLRAIDCFNVPVVVTLNHFEDDSEDAIATIKSWCQQQYLPFAVNDGYLQGGSGCVELAQLVVATVNKVPSKFTCLYDVDDKIENKIRIIAKKIYGADQVELTPQAQEKIKELEKVQLDALPICIAKTPLSFTDDAKQPYATKPFNIKISDIRISNGAGFIVALAGDILLMPGLPAVPAAERVEIDAIIAGKDEASLAYLATRKRLAEKIGIEVVTFDNANVLNTIASLNNDNDIDGYIVDRPYQGVCEEMVSAAIDPRKDVEGLSFSNIALRWLNKSSIAPSTAEAVIKILDFYNVEISGRLVAIIGRSVTVGRPLANLLSNRDASVILLHSRSKNCAAIAKTADIVVVAIGRPRIVDDKYFRDDAVIIDCGINEVEGKLVGDVNEEVKQGRTATPVPGGVGPVTNALLFANLLKLVEENNG
ncbi:c-1-tetrahydrofolate synthase cytoplasmic-related [Holotrichia oblita]|nr:c-1-tetrahydrofolate synthase cytoplasmic-related [Holotrichia oblita]